MSTTPPINVVVNAVQFTPGREPVLTQYSAHGVTTGPLAQTQLYHTTQTDLATRSGTPGAWGDDAVIASLTDHLAAHGITAVVVSIDTPVTNDAGDSA